MFIIFLRFAQNKEQASKYMNGHKAWLKQGFDDGIFLLSGSIRPQAGGFILANGQSMEEILNRVNSDPFVEQQIVSAEISEVSPAQAAEPMAFLLN